MGLFLPCLLCQHGWALTKKRSTHCTPSSREKQRSRKEPNHLSASKRLPQDTGDAIFFSQNWHVLGYFFHDSHDTIDMNIKKYIKDIRNYHRICIYFFRRENRRPHRAVILAVRVIFDLRRRLLDFPERVATSRPLVEHSKSVGARGLSAILKFTPSK